MKAYDIAKAAEQYLFDNSLHVYEVVEFPEEKNEDGERSVLVDLPCLNDRITKAFQAGAEWMFDKCQEEKGEAKA